MDYYELESCIEDWAADKGLLNSNNGMKQALKTLEEVTELMTAIENERIAGTNADITHGEAIMDAIGDIMVTLIIQAKIQDFPLEVCLEHAWHHIKDRKGKTVNGTFIKD